MIKAGPPSTQLSRFVDCVLYTRITEIAAVDNSEELCSWEPQVIGAARVTITWFSSEPQVSHVPHLLIKFKALKKAPSKTPLPQKKT